MTGGALIIAVLSSAIISATPILSACIGEIFSQRAGVMNLGLEGIMLMGAVTGYLTCVGTKSLALSVLVALIVGAAFGFIYALLTVTLQANQVVSGLAMMTFGTGLSGFIGKAVAHAASSVKFNKIEIPGLSKIPFIGDIFFKHDLLVYILFLLVPITWFYIYKTRAGLKLRALGENPGALDADGVNVYRLRYIYIMLGCALVALGGAYLTLAYTPFWTEGMTAGKGWIASALVIFASWNPLMAALGALLFGGINVIGNYVQLYYPEIPTHFIAMLPYVCTIVVLIFSTGNFRKKHSSSPAALTIPYDRESR